MHCMQVSLDAEHIRNEKVKVLHCMKQLTLDDVVVGQYRGAARQRPQLPRLPGMTTQCLLAGQRCS